VTESGGSIMIPVTRSGTVNGPVSVQVSTSNESAIAGLNYTAVTQTLSWADDDTSAKDIVIPILDDASATTDLTVDLTLSEPTGGATLGAPATATLTITTSSAVVQFASSQFVANISAGLAQVVVTRSGDLGGTVTATMSSPGGGDVAAFQEMVNFGPNITSATVTIPILNDGQPGAPDAAVPLALSLPGSGATLGAMTAATLVVHDNNPFPPFVTITSLGTPTIRVTTGVGKRARKKSETVIELHLSGALSGAGNVAAYQLFAGKVKKRVTTFNRRLPLISAVYNPAALTVTLFPAGKLNLALPEQLRVTAALLTDAYGRPLDDNQNFTASFSKRGVTIGR
jgi:hypothetical protein